MSIVRMLKTTLVGRTREAEAVLTAVMEAGPNKATQTSSSVWWLMTWGMLATSISRQSFQVSRARRTGAPRAVSSSSSLGSKSPQGSRAAMLLSRAAMRSMSS